MGGFFTLRTLAEIDGIKAACVMAPYDFALQSKLSATKEDARQNLDDLLAEGAPWLEGADAAALRKELLDHADIGVFPRDRSRKIVLREYRSDDFESGISAC